MVKVGHCWSSKGNLGSEMGLPLCVVLPHLPVGKTFVRFCLV